jgi:hypothetical protein
VADFNLRSVIRRVASTSTIRDPAVLAEEIMRHIPQEEWVNALRAALKPLVRDVISGERPHGTFTTGYGNRQRSGAIGPAVPSAGSSKVAAIRDGWQQHLRARYSVGEEWKFLGDCTYEDLQFIAGRLDHQAETRRSKAAGMRSLAAALTEHDAETVRDLPPELLMISLGAAA